MYEQLRLGEGEGEAQPHVKQEREQRWGQGWVWMPSRRGGQRKVVCEVEMAVERSLNDHVCCNA
jgi:hypothetical protein